MNYKIRYSSSSLSHYGIKGQQWGERRYQNEDGSLTPEGMERYGVGEGGHRLWWLPATAPFRQRIRSIY